MTSCVFFKTTYRRLSVSSFSWKQFSCTSDWDAICVLSLFTEQWFPKLLPQNLCVRLFDLDLFTITSKLQNYSNLRKITKSVRDARLKLANINLQLRWSRTHGGVYFKTSFIVLNQSIRDYQFIIVYMENSPLWLMFFMERWIWSFYCIVLRMTAKECTRIYNVHSHCDCSLISFR